MRRAICLTILLSTLASNSARGEASASTDAALAGDDAAPSFQSRTWKLLRHVDVVATPTRWRLTYPALTTVQRTTWLLGSTPTSPLEGWQDFQRPRVADDALAGLGGGINLRPSWPTLYRSPESDLSLTLAPGSLCTGACLKVSGSF